jgi:hypothetical protein
VDGGISLESWVERQERHIPHHIDQMRENYEVWLKTHPPRKPASQPKASSSAHMISVSVGTC